MPAPVSIYGIRHHGPGSARRLIEALDALKPEMVLIEGPIDATPLLPLLADPGMVPPVALLCYAEEDPSRASFFPFAIYSPEYQAVLWGVRNQATIRFIDLPSWDRLAEECDDVDAEETDPVIHDPIGVLARSAGYEDGESWWSDTIEETTGAGPVFEAVADAMTALRDDASQIKAREAAREAHMRLEIAKAAKEAQGPVAVICGAWHVPALTQKTSQAADKDLLRGRPKTKVRATWSPWTSLRLSRMSGYGAGVTSPGWFEHLWKNGDKEDACARWLTQVATALRDKGHPVSTASLIEAQRLSVALAAIRQRPAPGYEELTEAIVSVFCGGEWALWHEIEADILIGGQVGEIPDNTPLAPLMEDLQRQQRALKLKPEALERELALDLRTDNGLARSILLHRLKVLGVHWGILEGSGRSRGTFREKWKIAWEPEYAVTLVENLVHGTTIGEAADSRTMEMIQAQDDISKIAEAVKNAMTSDLPRSTAYGMVRLEEQAALDADALPLLCSLPPMADIIRYGDARTKQAGPIDDLMPRVAVRAAISLHYAVRSLDREASEKMREAILRADDAIRLAKLNDDVRETWVSALEAISKDTQASALIVGTVARLLYEADRIEAGEAADLLTRMLSPGTTVSEAAGFFEGFFADSGPRLIHDEMLRQAVDEWMTQLPKEEFISMLPLFRRVFSAMDRMERRRLKDAVFGQESGNGVYATAYGAIEIWPDMEDAIWRILEKEKAEIQDV